MLAQPTAAQLRELGAELRRGDRVLLLADHVDDSLLHYATEQRRLGAAVEVRRPATAEALAPSE